MKKDLANLEQKVENGKVLVYRYEPQTNGLNYRFWDQSNGPHLDPLEWTGPSDTNGFPLPTTNSPTFSGVSNATSISDAGQSNPSIDARYGIIDGWIYMPADGLLRDNNSNTGELGMVLLGDCCGGILTEGPGGNHTVNTGTADRGLLDPTPLSEGWHYIYNPQSDLSAFQGLDLEYSTNGGTSWADITQMRPSKLTLETQVIGFCDEIPTGRQLEPLEECCDSKYVSPGEEGHEELIAGNAGDLVADNRNDIDLRGANSGIIDQYARIDHKHPVRRQDNPGDPVITIIGPGTISSQLVSRRWSDEESYEFGIRVNVNTTTVNGWVRLVIPNIAGFQRPIISGIGSYRFGGDYDRDGSGADQNMSVPQSAWMGQEVNHYIFTQQIYIGRSNDKETDARRWVNFNVRYIRS